MAEQADFLRALFRHGSPPGLLDFVFDAQYHLYGAFSQCLQPSAGILDGADVRRNLLPSASRYASDARLSARRPFFRRL